MRNKSSFVILCCIAAVVMLMTKCVCGVKKPEIVQTGAVRGIIYDCNGLVLASNDTSNVSDSVGFGVIRSYPNPVAAQLLGYVGYATPADIDNDDINQNNLNLQNNNNNTKKIT